jgi:hypothetical protein
MTLITWTTSEAHCFTRWHYPWPQRCHGQSQNRVISARNQNRKIPYFVNRAVPNQERLANISLPGLEVVDWGETGDEWMQGIAKLRALSDGQQ